MTDRADGGPAGGSEPTTGSRGLAVRVLGELEVRVDGVVVPLRGDVRRRVFLALLAAPGSLGADELVASLWPDRPVDETAVNAVHAHVSRLRRLLLRPDGSGEWLVSEGPRYRLRPDHVDAVDLERRIVAAEGLVATEPAAARALLERVVAEVRRPVGDELPAWRALVDHWELRWRHAEEAWAGLVVGSPESAARADDLLELARAEPTREHRWSLAMRALALAGRQADALAAYREARAVLLEEVGVEPGADLRLTHEAVLRQARLSRAGWGPTVGAVAPPATSFVGREAELDALDRLVWRERAITVHGLGGMGKSRLLAEWVTRAGRGDSTHWVDLRGARPGDVAHRVAVQLGLAPHDDSPRASIEAIVVSTSALPVVLVLDDADAVVEEVGALVLTLTSCLPQLTVVTTSRRPLGVTGERLVALGPLGPEDAARLASDRSGGDGASAADAAERGGGVPLAVEVLATQPHDHAIRSVGGAGLRAAVHEAVAELSPQALPLLGALRTLPAGASSALVHRITEPLGEPGRRRVLRELIGSSLAVTEPRLRHDGSADLRHRVLQPVVDLTESDESGPTWATFGDWLLSHLPAVHGETPDWGRVKVVADEHANLDVALDRWRDDDPERLLHTAVRLAQWWAWSGQSTRGHRWISEALSGLADGAEPSTALRAEALMVSATGRGLGHLAASGAELDEAVALLQPDDDPGLRAGTLGLRAVARGWRGDLDGFDLDLAAARSASAQVERPWIDAHLDSAQALARAARGEPVAAIDDLLAVAERFAEIGDGHGRTVALHFAITVGSIIGDDRLDGLVDLAQDVANADGSPAARALIAGEAAKHGLRRAVRAGAGSAEVVERMERAALDLERVGNGRTAAVVRRDLGLHLVQVGDRGRAEGELRTAAERLLVLDPGAGALAVGGLVALGVGSGRGGLAAAAWELSTAGGTPLLASDRQLLERLAGPPGPPPASHAAPAEAVSSTVDEVLAVLGIPRLDLGA